MVWIRFLTRDEEKLQIQVQGNKNNDTSRTKQHPEMGEDWQETVQERNIFYISVDDVEKSFHFLWCSNTSIVWPKYKIEGLYNMRIVFEMC